VAEFTRGECAYRAVRPAEYCERYFGAPPEWLDRHRLSRAHAREVVRSAWRALRGEGWRSGARGARFATAMLREALTALPVAAAGPRLTVLAAGFRLGLARFRLSCLARGDEARYRAYRRLWDAMVSYVRIEYLARQAPRPPAPRDAGLHLEIGDLPDDRLVGFHGRETWQGRTFRWMGAVGTMWLGMRAACGEVSLDTGGLLGPGWSGPVAVFWNGRRVSHGGPRREDGRVSFALRREWFEPGGEQSLTLACAPIRRPSREERRRLALPIFSLTFAPAPGETDARPPTASGVAVADPC
jgi:hypothetical protein